MSVTKKYLSVLQAKLEEIVETQVENMEKYIFKLRSFFFVFVLSTSIYW